MPTDVTVQTEEGICVLTIDNPPVNALSAGVRRALFDAIEQAEKDPEITAIVLTGGGRAFIGGADIREFGKPPLEPMLGAVCNRIEACEKPVIAALNGVALGGGMEIALAAHYRVAVNAARMGLPEVNLGLLPGAGGTQRTTRLVGAKVALDMMLTGRQVKPGELLACGLIDEASEQTDAKQAGLTFARQIVENSRGTRPTRNRDEGLLDAVANRAALEEARSQQTQRSKNLFAPFRIIEAVEGALNLPFDEGLVLERSLFVQCMDSPQRSGLIHAFFSERAAAKSPDTAQIQPRELNSIGVIGGGTMGTGITVAMLDAGFPVVMVERDAQSLERGRASVDKIYARQLAKGRINESEKNAIMGSQFKGSTDYTDLAQVDLIVEAVFEDIEVKKTVFTQIDKVAKAGAILATNTSYLDINEIAASISRPDEVVGLHFFSPANIMKLLEIVVADKTQAEVVATSFALAKKLRKVGVRAGVCDGFIGNRILATYRQAADYMLEDGASPYAIDAAMRDFGYPMGPYQVSDLAGGDIGWATRKRKAATRDPNARYVEIADRICERGWFGQKTGRGYYLYENGSRVGTSDPEVEAIIDTARKVAGVTPREFSTEEIVQRYLAAMINEAANVVAEKIALRPLDVDVTLLHGYGFPRWRGGPMKYADDIGLDKILADIQSFAQEDPIFWKPSPLLRDLVERGDTFSSLNEL